MAYVALTKAALGEKVPAKPPDSFQATRASAPPVSLTKMPRSWLKPALAVQRSALAPSTAVALAAGESVVLKLAASMICQLAPLESASVYCWVETAKLGAVPVGKASVSRLVGEKVPAPAPAKIVA